MSINYSLSQLGNIINTDANGAITSLNTSAYSANLGPVGNVTITGGSNGQVLTTDGSGVLTWSTVSAGNSANANYANFAGTVTDSSQSNITSVGTLTGLTVSGTSNLGAVGNVTITGGSNGQVLTTNGSGVLSWAAGGGGGSGGEATKLAEYEVFYSNPGSPWLPAGSGPYNVSSYPELGNMFANTTSAAGAAVNYVAGQGSTTAFGFGGGRYIRIGSVNPTTGTPTQFSTDGGATWTAGGNLPALSSGSWASNITWNGTVFFVVAYINGQGIGATSTNGVTWTQRNLPTPTGSGYFGVGSSGSILAATQYSATTGGSRVAISSDNGATWTSTILPFNQADFIAGGDGKFVTAIYGGTVGAMSSDNGSTWTSFTLPNATWDCAIWTGTYWLMGHQSGTSILAMSFDGLNWFSVANPAGGGASNSPRLVWNGRYVLQADTANTRVLVYTDPRGNINQIGSMGGSWWVASDSSNVNRFVRDLNTQSVPVTITQATTFTAGAAPTSTGSSLGTWWISSANSSPSASAFTGWTTVPVILSAVTTPPTKGTIAYDRYRYRKVGDKVYQLQLSFRNTAGGTGGSGIYLYTLPAGLQFDLNVQPASTNGNSTSPQTGAAWGTKIPGSTGMVYVGGSIGHMVAMAYDATRFYLTTIAGIGGAVYGGIQHGGYFQLGQELNIEFDFTFTATT